MSRSYAQFAEDQLLAEIFADQSHGRCVEVGANDGRTGSATLAFEQRGWECLLVEPIPALAAQIRRHRRCAVLECAASSESGTATLHVADSVEGMSTLDLTRGRKKWIEREGGHVRPITVPTRRLDDMLDDVGFRDIDFITIDVEGHELQVLQGLSLQQHRPRIMIIENNALHPDQWPRLHSPVRAYLAARGFVQFRRTGVNEWYAHEADASLLDGKELNRFAWTRRRDFLRQARRRLVHEVAYDVGRLLPERVKAPLRRLGPTPPSPGGFE